MSKTNEELNELKKEAEAVNEKLQELSKEELEKITGGHVQICHIGEVDAEADISDAAVTWQGKTAGRVETSATGQSGAVKPDRFR